MQRWILTGLLLTACEPIPPQSLDDIDFPEGTRLDTHREIPFHVSAAPESDLDTMLSVRLPDGQPLYEGAARLAVDHPLVLRLPPGVTELTVTARVNGVVVDDVTIPVEAWGEATYDLGS